MQSKAIPSKFHSLLMAVVCIILNSASVSTVRGYTLHISKATFSSIGENTFLGVNGEGGFLQGSCRWSRACRKHSASFVMNVRSLRSIVGTTFRDRQHCRPERSILLAQLRSEESQPQATSSPREISDRGVADGANNMSRSASKELTEVGMHPSSVRTIGHIGRRKALHSMLWKSALIMGGSMLKSSSSAAAAAAASSPTNGALGNIPLRSGFSSLSSSIATAAAAPTSPVSTSAADLRGVWVAVTNEGLLEELTAGISGERFPLKDENPRDVPPDLVRKRPTDDRQYKALTLPNELRVLLVSDPSTTRAAAALDVHAGAFSDPKEVPGIAHFCEHMLFLGTKKYPKEDDFSGFLSTHGGSSNAYTASEDTCYYFDVNAGYLDEALDRFAQFFIAPLFTESATGRELNAIESEHAKNINNDGFRLYQLEKDDANPAHPMNKFSTGNKFTLDTNAKKQGLDIRELLLDYHSRYYSANLMTLTIVGSQPVAQLQAWAETHFSDIPNKRALPPTARWWGAVPPYLPISMKRQASASVKNTITPAASGSGGIHIPGPLLVGTHAVEGESSLQAGMAAESGASRIQQQAVQKAFEGVASEEEVVPIGQLRSITIAWPVWVPSPEARAALQVVRPEIPISHLLGHEGAGSLRAFFVKRGWANEVQAAVGNEVSDLDMFEFSVDLTEEGFRHRNEVLEGVFAYLHLLSPPRTPLTPPTLTRAANPRTAGTDAVTVPPIPAYIYDELEQLSDIGFNFAEKSDASSLASDLAANMQSFLLPAQYLTGPRLFHSPFSTRKPFPFVPPAPYNVTFAQLEQDLAKEKRQQKKQINIDHVSDLTTKNGLNGADAPVVAANKLSARRLAALGTVNEYLAQLRPETARIRVVSSDFEGKTKEIGRFYGTKYNKRLLPKETARWREVLRNSDKKYESELHLPAQNIFIPEDFSLLGSSGARKISEKEKLAALRSPPRLIRSDDRWEVWHKLDKTFAQPRVYAVFSLSIPAAAYTTAFVVNSKLFAACFLDSINEDFLYDAGLAGQGFQIEFTSKGMQFTLSGYNDKLPVFTERVFTALKTFQPDRRTFDRVKEVMARQYASWRTEQPYSHASYYTSLATETLSFSIEDLQKELLRGNNCKLENLQNFINDVISTPLSVSDDRGIDNTKNNGYKREPRSFGTVLIEGNIDEAGSAKLVQIVERTFPFSSLPIDQRSVRRIGLIPSTSTSTSTSTLVAEKDPISQAGAKLISGYRLAAPEPNENDDNSATSFYFQLPSFSPELYMYVELLADILEQPFFQSLRTQQQLGYIVYSGIRNREGIHFLTFVVQSSVIDGPEITRRIQYFMENDVPRIIFGGVENLKSMLRELQAEEVGAKSPQRREYRGRGDERGARAGLSAQELEEFKTGIAVKKLEPDQRLTAQAGRFWAEISVANRAAIVSSSSGSPSPQFFRAQREVDVVNKIQIEDFQRFVALFLYASPKEKGSVVFSVGEETPLCRRLFVTEITSNKPAPAAAAAAAARRKGGSQAGAVNASAGAMDETYLAVGKDASELSKFKNFERFL